MDPNYPKDVEIHSAGPWPHNNHNRTFDVKYSICPLGYIWLVASSKLHYVFSTRNKLHYVFSARNEEGY